jgi:hypothetical protein
LKRLEGKRFLKIYINYLESDHSIDQQGVRWDKLVDGTISGSYPNGIFCVSGFDSSSYFATEFVEFENQETITKFYKQR